MTALEPSGAAGQSAVGDYRCGFADCGQLLRKCRNYSVENVCNRCYVSEGEHATTQEQSADVVGIANRLCVACQLTETIPDLSVAGNREKWARLEAAKRRLLYTLDTLRLPYANAKPKLTFDFKADVERPANEWRNAGPTEIVFTGHVNGKVTINTREADDAIRESLRCQFHEAHRTLIGHFHHEVGHYYWELLVRGRREDQFHNTFGNHESPTYEEAMSDYYRSGPKHNWQESFVSAYASAHPWEDFAETFALYLDMASVLDSAAHFFTSLDPKLNAPSVEPLVNLYQKVGILVNEFNRTLGLLDLVPEVVIPPIVAKLEFVHSLVLNADRTTANNESSQSPLPAV